MFSVGKVHKLISKKEGKMKILKREQDVNDLVYKVTMREVSKIVKENVLLRKENVGTVNIPGVTFISPKLCELGEYSKDTDEWTAKEEDGVFLLELFPNAPTTVGESIDDTFYYLLKTTDADFFVKLSEKEFVIVKNIPVSFIKKAVGGLLQWIGSDLH